MLKKEVDILTGLLKKMDELKSVVAYGGEEFFEVDDSVVHTSVFPSPFLENPEILFPVLCTHAVFRPNGSIIVTAPVTTLQHRAHLLPREARTILEMLERKGFIERVDMWNEARIPEEKYIHPSGKEQRQEIKEKLKQGSSRQIIYDWRALAYPSLPGIHSTQSVPGHESLDLSFPQIYQRLLARSVITGKRRLLRGAVPFLQMEMRVGPSDAVKVLEFLEQHKEIKRIDGWRVLELLVPSSGSVESLQDIIGTETGISRVGTTFPFAINLAELQDTSVVLDRAITLLKERFATLRTVAEEMQARVAMLEETLTVLCKARDEHRSAENPQEILQQVQDAYEEIGKILRLKRA